MSSPTLRAPSAEAWWPALNRRYQGFTPRERALVTLCCTVVLGLVLDRVWVAPAWSAWGQARLAHQQAGQALHAMESSLVTLQQRQDLDTRQRQAELAALQARAAQDHQRSGPSDLVQPAEMVPLLEQLIRRHGSLRLRGLESLGRTVLSPGTPTLYRHGVELRVEGRYADLVDYLKTLEALPQRLLWGDLQLQVLRHPQVLLTLRLHTLSTHADWVQLQ
jgi:MSHA biogenesis protein MshJ